MYTQAMDVGPREERKAVRSTAEAELEARFDARIDDGGLIEAKDWAGIEKLAAEAAGLASLGS